MNRSNQLFRYSLIALAAATMVACNDNDGPTPAPAPSTPVPVPGPTPSPNPNPAPNPTPAPSALVPDTFVLTSGNRLVGFRMAAPGTTSTVTLAIPATETLLGGDFRAADSTFYVVTRVTADNSLRVYPANTSSGALGTAIVLLNNGMGAGGGTAAAPITLTGAKVGVDFNPLANALRIVDDTGVNLRTGLGAGNNTFLDAPISAGLAEAAYTNSFANTCQTDLYHVNRSQLLLSAAPNGVTGNLAVGARLVGGFGLTADDANIGFDARTTATGNVLTTAFRVGGTYRLYSHDANTGAATNLGTIGGLGSDNVLSLVATLPSTAPSNQPGNLLAITSGSTQNLLSFNRPPQGTAGRLCDTTAITGLTAGDVIVGADTRPATGQLVALAKNGTVGRLYTIASNGAATLLSTLVDDPAAAPVFTGLTGNSFSVDFNPVPDRLRVIGDDGQNLRINVANGLTSTDTTVSNTQGGAARVGITGVGYTNSLGGGDAATLTTTLFGIDSTTNELVRIGADPGNGVAGNPDSPNSGVVNVVAPLTLGGAPLDIGANNALEIEGTAGGNPVSLLAATVGSTTSFYTLNLATGVAMAAGTLPAPVVGLATRGAQTAQVFGVTSANRLIRFSPAAPGTVTDLGVIAVPAGETVQGIDTRPSIGPKNGVLTILTTASGGVGKFYTVNPADASLGPVAPTLAANPADTTLPYTGIAGAAVGIDFNPLPDALRTVSNTAENLRSSPDSGLTFTDAVLDTNNVFAAAYSNNYTTAASTELFYLRTNSGADTSLLRNMGNPNDGVTQPVGPLTGFITTNVGDLDIAGGRNGFALAALQPQGGVSTLFRINLVTGTALSVGAINAPNGETVRGIAVRFAPSTTP